MDISLEDGLQRKMEKEQSFHRKPISSMKVEMRKNIYAYLLKKEQAGVVYVSFSYKKAQELGIPKVFK